MLAKANAGSDDRYYAAGHIFRAVSCMNQVLFAINDTYCINEKKAVRMIETFEHRPAGYVQKVNRIFEELGVSLNKCCDKAESLYDIRHIQVADRARVLDLACGKGAVSVKLAAGLGCKIKGIDIIPEFIDFAVQKAQEYGVAELCEFAVE